MTQYKRRRIEEQLRSSERRLSNAEEYVEKGVNVEGSAWLHLDDYRGKSGHPLWMKNHMIPRTLKALAKKERILEALDSKAKDTELANRRRRGAR